MKKLYLIFVAISLAATMYGQAPAGFKYQAVARNASGLIITNTQVTIQIAILKGSISGTSVYTETFTPTTNNFGLVNLNIGTGTVVSGSFGTIDWGVDIYFIKVWLNATEMGTSQLMSVPYALHAKTVASYPETDPTVKAINGIVKSNGTTISSATAGTDYLTPTGSAASLTGFPILNQNTTGSAASFTGNLVGEVTGTQGATIVGNSAVLGKVLTGYISGAGTVAATDNILQAIQKLNGNNSAHYIGESYGGGIVFYVYDNGKHGLIAATADQSTGVVWITAAYKYSVSNAVRDGINGGLANTERIIIQAGAGSYPAQLCANYNGGNYADWYLPSKYELNLLYLQKTVVGGFANPAAYWSSTEASNSAAWAQGFGGSGIQNGDYKDLTNYVRAVRAF